MNKAQAINNAVEDMASKVKMVKRGRGHSYVGQVAPIEGKLIAGVTSVTKSLSGFTPDIAAMYGAKQMSLAMGDYEVYEGEEPDESFAEETLQEIKAIENVKDYVKFIRNAKKRHKEHSQKALDVGKAGHEIVEAYVNRRIAGKSVKGYIGQEFIDKALKEFYEWADAQTFFLSEALVCMTEPYETRTKINGGWKTQHLHTEYAGTLDILVGVEDRLAVLDIKFAERIGREYGVQTSAYAKPFSKYGIEVKDRIIIRVPKTEYLKEYIGKGMYKRVENKLEIQHLPEADMEHDFNVFLHEREVFRWKNKKV